jgi:hypothetical protein
MNTVADIIVTLFVAMALLFSVWWLLRAYAKYRGEHVVTCPETGRPAVVEVNARRAALTSAVGHPDISLESCWRWPLKQSCGQECLTQLDSLPERCLILGVLMRWYTGKSCIYCAKTFTPVQWIDHKPALRSPAGTLLEWKDIKIKEIPEVLKSHQPVCWDCYIAQTFLREYPDLVVYRPWKENTFHVRG